MPFTGKGQLGIIMIVMKKKSGIKDGGCSSGLIDELIQTLNDAIISFLGSMEEVGKASGMTLVLERIVQ